MQGQNIIPYTLSQEAVIFVPISYIKYHLKDKFLHYWPYTDHFVSSYFME